MKIILRLYLVAVLVAHYAVADTTVPGATGSPETGANDLGTTVTGDPGQTGATSPSANDDSTATDPSQPTAGTDVTSDATDLGANVTETSDTVTEAGSTVTDSGDKVTDPAPTGKCAADEIEMAGSCVTEYAVPAIAVGAFLFLLIVIIISVACYRKSHPWKDENLMLYSDSNKGALWARAKSLPEGDLDKPVANGNLSNGRLDRFDYDNEAFDEEEQFAQQDGSTRGRGNSDNRSNLDNRYNHSLTRRPNECNSTPQSQRRENHYMNPQDEERPIVEDTYMRDLEMSDVYRGFHANLGGVSRAANYSIQRPRVKPYGSALGSVRSGDSVFTGAEVQI